MAIAQRPKRKHTDPEEHAVEEFIRGAERDAGNADQADKPAGKSVPVMVRMKPELLRRIDRAVGRRYQSRSAWIIAACVDALEREE